MFANTQMMGADFGFPDAFVTPSPSGPVPIPYPTATAAPPAPATSSTSAPAPSGLESAMQQLYGHLADFKLPF